MLNIISKLYNLILSKFNPKTIYSTTGCRIVQVGPKTALVYLDHVVALPGAEWKSANILSTGVKIMYDTQVHIVPQGCNTPVILCFGTSGNIYVSNTLTCAASGDTYIRTVIPIILA